MVIFKTFSSRLTAKAKQLSTEPTALWWLFLIAVLEALVLPIPTELVLFVFLLNSPVAKPVCIAVAAVGSTLGSVSFYPLGAFAFDSVLLWLAQYGYETDTASAQRVMEQYGPWSMLVGSFTPVPLKLLSLLNGVAGASFVNVTFLCLVGQLLRFYVALWVLMASRKGYQWVKGRF